MDILFDDNSVWNKYISDANKKVIACDGDIIKQQNIVAEIYNDLREKYLEDSVNFPWDFIVNWYVGQQKICKFASLDTYTIMYPPIRWDKIFQNINF